MHILRTILSVLLNALPDLAGRVFAVLGVSMSFPDKAAEIEKDERRRKGMLRFVLC
jgi:hypothetical protein